MIIFDSAFFAELTDNDVEMQHELLNIFVTQMKDDVAKMQQSFDSKDIATWVGCAHKIYGSAANIGAVQLANSCNIAQSLHDVEKITHYHAIIIEQYQQLSQIIS